jgi:hypothetical protein
VVSTQSTTRYGAGIFFFFFFFDMKDFVDTITYCRELLIKIKMK